MKCRRLPFGYIIENGELCINSDEARVIESIYDDYLCGGSFQSIANGLSGGNVRYSKDTSLWNKNMVKRILENSKYTGEAPYPLIIGMDIYSRAERIRIERRREYSIPVQWLNALKGTVLCAECASTLVRFPKKRPAKWLCSNENCRAAPTDDRLLLEKITTVLNRLIDEPEQIQIPPVDISIQSTALSRLNNEFNRLIDARGL